MSFREFVRRSWFFLRGSRRDSDIREEMRDHLEQKIEANIALGMNAEEARFAALRQFGNPALIAEQAHSAFGFSLLESLMQDLRYGMRVLRRNPGFTAAAVGTLALGIGANTAVFSIVNAVLLKSLPYLEPSRLVAFRSSNSFPDLMDIGEQSQTLAAAGTIGDWPLDLVGKGEPERVDGAMLGGDVFTALGVPPVLGRTFSEADDKSLNPVAVVSYAFWQSHLGGDSAAVGKPLQLSGKQYTVIGVMPPEFQMPVGKSQLWIPLRVAYPEAVEARGAHFMFALGRLRDGYTVEQSQAEITQIGTQLGKLHPEEARVFHLLPLRDRMVGVVRTPLLILFGAAGLVLLIACSNFASLLMARTVTRAQEMKVRSAIGAGRWRLIRQLLTESALLSLIGAVVGIAVAAAGLRFLLSLKPDEISTIHRITIDHTALLFAVLSALLTGVLFGIAPAFEFLQLSKPQGDGSRIISTRTVLRKSLVVTQLSLALVLLVGAGLLIRSFWRLQSIPLGFNPEGLLSLRMTLPTARYGPIEAQEAFLTRLDGNLKTVPGVESSAIVTELPLSGSRMMHNMQFRDLPPVPEGQEPEIYAHEISPEYFKTLQMKLVAGREFSLQDGPKAPAVGIVNETFARRFFPGQYPIGREVKWARGKELPWITIVGVVQDIRAESLDEEQEPTIYTPFTQKMAPWKRSEVIVVRGNGAVDPGAIRRAVWSLDSQLPITDVLPLRSVIDDSVKERRFNMVLLAIFAGLAFVLAAVGVYGVIAYLVAQRTREIGVRVALGAQRLDILWLVLRQGLQLLAIGIVLGTVGALLASSLLRDLVYGIGVTDRLTFIAGFVGLFLVGIAATYIPARRAMRLDPMVALRFE